MFTGLQREETFQSVTLIDHHQCQSYPQLLVSSEDCQNYEVSLPSGL